MATTTETLVVPKVWGEEHWIVNGEYCGKKLVLRQGFRCSMHYHKVKDEVFYVIKGKVLLETEAGDHLLEPGDHRHIPQRLLHRFSGLEDSEIIEFSSHHEDADSYRTEPSGPFDLASVRLPGAAPRTDGMLHPPVPPRNADVRGPASSASGFRAGGPGAPPPARPSRRE